MGRFGFNSIQEGICHPGISWSNSQGADFISFCLGEKDAGNKSSFVYPVCLLAVGDRLLAPGSAGTAFPLARL